MKIINIRKTTRCSKARTPLDCVTIGKRCISYFFYFFYFCCFGQIFSVARDSVHHCFQDFVSCKALFTLKDIKTGVLLESVCWWLLVEYSTSVSNHVRRKNTNCIGSLHHVSDHLHRDNLCHVTNHCEKLHHYNTDWLITLQEWRQS